MILRYDRLGIEIPAGDPDPIGLLGAARRLCITRVTARVRLSVGVRPLVVPGERLPRSHVRVDDRLRPIEPQQQDPLRTMTAGT
jgi:hypothetical protein